MTSNNPGNHSGHRKRLRNKFLVDGINGMTDVTALELLLCFAIPRKDVRPLAETLLAQFGTYVAVLHAPPDQLRAIPGVSDNTVALLMLIRQSLRLFANPDVRLEDSHFKRSFSVDKLIPFLEGRKDEVLYLVGLDDNEQIISVRLLGAGGLGSLEVPIIKVISTAMTMEAHNIVLVHNHPQGNIYPSDADLSSTVAVQSALTDMGIFMLDHFILTNTDCFSIRDFILENL